MKRTAAWIGIAVLGLALAGCETISDAPAGAYKVGAAYEVTLGGEWSDISKAMAARPATVHLLSVDGPLLNRLYLTEGLASGDYLVKPAGKDQRTPTYRSGMSQTEQVEFVADSVAALDYQRVETSNLRPAKFAGSDGVRFDIAAKTPEGLDMSGTAMVADRSGKLVIVLYLAPTEHYFRLHLQEVEAILASAHS